MKTKVFRIDTGDLLVTADGVAQHCTVRTAIPQARSVDEIVEMYEQTILNLKAAEARLRGRS